MSDQQPYQPPQPQEAFPQQGYQPPQYGQPPQAPQYSQPPQYPQYPQPAYVQAPPAEIGGWNWGAFMFCIPWGIGNKTYKALLCLVPLLGVVWPFICGAKGNEWAWLAGNYTDPYTFKAVQDTWNRAGKVFFFIALAFIVLYIIIFIALGASLFALFNTY